MKAEGRKGAVVGPVEAKVVAVFPSRADVLVGGLTMKCVLSGRLRRRRGGILAGDLVTVSGEGADCVVESILPRRNRLTRPPIANVDLVVVMTAVTMPPLDLVYIDRILVHLEVQDIDAVVCVNKSDIEDPDQVRRIADIYQAAGYSVFVTSAVTGEGLPDLVECMQGRIAVLAGASGVGKTKLIAGLLDRDLVTGKLTRRSRGRHTTKGVTLYRAGPAGFLADTPGFSRIDAIEREPHELGYYYREMAPLAPLCHYPRCIHKTEASCKVRDAVGAGTIAAERYSSYLLLLEELLEKEKRKYV